MDTTLEIIKIFREEHYSCSLRPFSWIFADIPPTGSSFSRLVSSNPSSRLVYTDFGLISNMVAPCFKPCAFIQSFFFSCWKALLKLDVNQFFSIFQFLTVEAVFPASGIGFSIECYSFRRVGKDFLSIVLLFKANFVLVQTII